MKIEDLDNYTIAKVLIAYLVEAKSHRQIQREILELPAPANGGGFETMKILHYYNLKEKSKGILKNNFHNLHNLNPEVIKILEEFFSIKDEAKNLINRRPINPANKDTEKWYMSKARIYQDVFKQYISENYNYTCAMCDNDQPELLVASHIIPWSNDKDKRLELENGILLCNLHDKLFDKGFITLDEKYNLIISKKLSKNVAKLLADTFFKVPNTNPPKQEYIQFHRDEIFIR